MKTYKKITEGRVNIVCPGHGTAIINGVEVSNPTEQMLIADGWTDITIPYHERDLTDAKKEKIRSIENLAASGEVRKFTLNGTEVWFDAETRTSLRHRFDCEEEDGRTATSLWYGGKEFRLTMEDAKDVIAQAELYAASVYDKAEKDKAKVNALTSIAAVDAYDERQGYPESPEVEKEVIVLNSIYFDKRTQTTKVGDEFELTALFMPEGAYAELNWYTNNDKVRLTKVTDVKYKVTALAAGTSQVFAKGIGTVFAALCDVTITA